MNVIAPSNVEFQQIFDLSGNYAAGTAGAGMNLRIGVAPWTVSFGGILIREIGDGEHGAARGVQGYFERFSAAALRHAPTAAWSDIVDSNFTDTARDQGDTAASRPGAYPAPWRAGTYHWEIPYHYKVQGTSGDGYRFATTRQTFQIAADGKGTESVSRSPGPPQPAQGAPQAAPVQQLADGALLEDPFAVHMIAARG